LNDYVITLPIVEEPKKEKVDNRIVIDFDSPKASPIKMKVNQSKANPEKVVQMQIKK